MATFDEESRKTAQKLSDVVMEYTAQFIAEDYLDEYSRAQRRKHALHVPRELDDKMYQFIDEIEKIETKDQVRHTMIKRLKAFVFALGCFSIVVLGFVLSVEGVRQALMMYFGF